MGRKTANGGRVGKKTANGGFIGGQIATLSLTTTVVSVSEGLLRSTCLDFRNDSGGGTIAND